MLWYLYLAATEDVVVVGYEDHPSGTLEIDADGVGRFTEITLHPTVTVQHEGGASIAAGLHERAHELCFVANSVNFPVHVDRTVHIAAPA
jgi:organic hydroperoxide reductase OsmC/OhrA